MAKARRHLVLVVDDEEDILAYLSAALEDAGFDVITAKSGQEALATVKKQRPDFISLDLVMPGGSGISFLHELRRNRDWINIPVMVVTGHAKDDLGRADLEHALDSKLLSGPHAYLEKPVRADSYVAAICHALGIQAPELPGSSPELRSEVDRLLAEASPEKLAEVAALLKRGS
jgi:CheY-like chemotaxis protein